MSLSKGREEQKPFNKGGRRGKDLWNLYFDTFQQLTLLKWNQNFSYHKFPCDQPEKTYKFIGQQTHTIYNSITWNHGNHVLGKEVTWCLTLCISCVQSYYWFSHRKWESTILWLWLKTLKSQKTGIQSMYLSSWPLCFKLQFSVLRKPFDQLIQMGKMVCSTDLVLAIHLRAVLSYPSASLAHLSSTHPGNLPL